jgi:hypothetical protein
MTRLLFLCTAAVLAAPALAQPATIQALPQPSPVAELAISLAVAEARCTGKHREMIARYRPQLMRLRAEAFKAAGIQMAQRYSQAHGAAWRAALDADMAGLRDRYEQHPDPKRFCRQASIQARELSSAHESAIGVFYDGNGQLRQDSLLLGPLR